MAPARTFVAVELPDAVGRALAATIDGLRRVVDGVRWVRPEGVHLTLKFLGDVEEAWISEVVGAVERVAGEASPFTLQTGGVGGFPRRDRARVLWVGVEGDLEALAGLQAGVECALESLGFPPERRTYFSHLTLGRARRRPVAMPELLSVLGDVVRFRVDRVSVMKSELRPDGAAYSALGYGVLKLEG